MKSEVRIGTSGWNYPSGKGTWNGIFYPPPRKRPRGFDELSFYAEHFNTVEVNSTFYGQPRAEVTRAWAGRTPTDFEFSIKLYQKFTHLRDQNDFDADAFRLGIDPLASSGRLGALLVQFPASFKDSPENREHLAQLLRTFGEYPLAVELRHKTWSDRQGETLQLLNALRAALVQIDEPKFRLSIRQNQLPNVEGFYYMRLHGRNAAQWWKHDKSEDRYNYLYSGDELKAFVETADAARRIVKKAYLYTNNHFSAKSVANAAMIKRQLGEPLTGEYPPEFVERYPEVGLPRAQSSGVTASRTSGEFDLHAPTVRAPRRRS